jgi:predicted acylesterase/phospholipase RssA
MEDTRASAAPRYCDIVMKGGITSGVVYPAAVYEISKDFTFKNVGGTSAGAIAAALTAAAERRRAFDGSNDGFARLSRIPDYLKSDDHLRKLFAPNISTRALYHTVTELFGRARLVDKWFALVKAFPFTAIAGAVPGAAFLLAEVRRPAMPPLDFLGIFLAALTIIAGITIAVAIALVRNMLVELPKNYYGMVTGVDDVDRISGDALCTWLTRELEETAGLDGDVKPLRPLTFSMLWDTKRAPGEEGCPQKPSSIDVNLEMITTNLTYGRPYSFPSNVSFYYDPKEMRKFFPDHVVAWMESRPRKPTDAREAAHFKAYGPEKLPLPSAGDLPVIVATRMSLAFPILLCAVPLYAADHSIEIPTDQVPKLEKCWFSDGGISSNFPVTLFDSPLPRWPTFAIDLENFPPGRKPDPDEAENVHMPDNNAAGILPRFTRFKDLLGFLSALLNAMQNWNDNTQCRLPGYRDRIVTVFLDGANEGGLNLDMPPEVLDRLRARGTAAGALLVKRFKAPSLLPSGEGAMNWENHRWLRLRTALGAAKAYLTAMARSTTNPEAPDVTYDALIKAIHGTPVHHYPLTPGTNEEIADIADRLAQFGVDIQSIDAVDANLPKPPPELVLRGSLEA